MRVLAAAATVLIAAGWAMPAAAATAGETTLFTLRDARLDEVSGIAHGIASPHTYYVQNDSGDTARFFALDARSGRVQAAYRVPDATNVDWEDLAVAPDSHGVASVWLADTGDNDADRDEVQLYRVDEPHVRASGGSRTTGRPDVWHLRYPSGPVDVESLAVSPHGRAYLITKSATGRSVVYAVPQDPRGTVQVVRRIGILDLAAEPASLVPVRYQRLVTGAALARDGTTLVVRTYTTAFVWRVRDGDVAAAIRSRPHRVTLPLQPQGEGVCIVGDDLVVSSESVGSAVYSLPIGWPGARPSPSPSLPSPRSDRAASPFAAGPAATANTGAGLSAASVALIAGLGGAVVVAGAVALLRRRHAAPQERQVGQRDER